MVYSEGVLQAASKSGPAELYVDRVFTNAAPKNIRYKSALQVLKENANEHSLKYLSNVCGVPVETIEAVAKEFTSHGTKVVAVSNTGNNGWDSVMSSWLICILNTLAGSLTERAVPLTATEPSWGSAATMTWKMSKAEYLKTG